MLQPILMLRTVMERRQLLNRKRLWQQTVPHIKPAIRLRLPTMLQRRTRRQPMLPWAMQRPATLQLQRLVPHRRQRRMVKPVTQAILALLQRATRRMLVAVRPPIQGPPRVRRGVVLTVHRLRMVPSLPHHLSHLVQPHLKHLSDRYEESGGKGEEGIVWSCIARRFWTYAA